MLRRWGMLGTRLLLGRRCLGLPLLACLHPGVVVRADTFGDLTMFSRAFNLVRGKRNVRPRLPVDPLLCQRAVIHSRQVMRLEAPWP